MMRSLTHVAPHGTPSLLSQSASPQSPHELGRRLLPNAVGINPIEQAFAKLKGALRKAAARTFEGLIQASARALTDFKSQECATYIANSGYRRRAS